MEMKEKVKFVCLEIETLISKTYISRPELFILDIDTCPRFCHIPCLEGIKLAEALAG